MVWSPRRGQPLLAVCFTTVWSPRRRQLHLPGQGGNDSRGRSQVRDRPRVGSLISGRTAPAVHLGASGSVDASAQVHPMAAVAAVVAAAAAVVAAAAVGAAAGAGGAGSSG